MAGEPRGESNNNLFPTRRRRRHFTSGLASRLFSGSSNNNNSQYLQPLDGTPSPPREAGVRRDRQGNAVKSAYCHSNNNNNNNFATPVAAAATSKSSLSHTTSTQTSDQTEPLWSPSPSPTTAAWGSLEDVPLTPTPSGVTRNSSSIMDPDPDEAIPAPSLIIRSASMFPATSPKIIRGSSTRHTGVSPSHIKSPYAARKSASVDMIQHSLMLSGSGVPGGDSDSSSHGRLTTTSSSNNGSTDSSFLSPDRPGLKPQGVFHLQVPQKRALSTPERMRLRTLRQAQKQGTQSSKNNPFIYKSQPMPERQSPGGRVTSGVAALGVEMMKGVFQPVKKWVQCEPQTRAGDDLSEPLPLVHTPSTVSGASTEVATNRAVDLALKRIRDMDSEIERRRLEAQREQEQSQIQRKEAEQRQEEIACWGRNDGDEGQSLMTDEEQDDHAELAIKTRRRQHRLGQEDDGDDPIPQTFPKSLRHTSETHSKSVVAGSPPKIGRLSFGDPTIAARHLESKSILSESDDESSLVTQSIVVQSQLQTNPSASRLDAELPPSTITNETISETEPPISIFQRNRRKFEKMGGSIPAVPLPPLPIISRQRKVHRVPQQQPDDFPTNHRTSPSPSPTVEVKQQHVGVGYRQKEVAQAKEFSEQDESPQKSSASRRSPDGLALPHLLEKNENPQSKLGQVPPPPRQTDKTISRTPDRRHLKTSVISPKSDILARKQQQQFQRRVTQTRPVGGGVYLSPARSTSQRIPQVGAESPDPVFCSKSISSGMTGNTPNSTSDQYTTASSSDIFGRNSSFDSSIMNQSKASVPGTPVLAVVPEDDDALQSVNGVIGRTETEELESIDAALETPRSYQAVQDPAQAPSVTDLERHRIADPQAKDLESRHCRSAKMWNGHPGGGSNPRPGQSGTAKNTSQMGTAAKFSSNGGNSQRILGHQEGNISHRWPPQINNIQRDNDIPKKREGNGPKPVQTRAVDGLSKEQEFRNHNSVGIKEMIDVDSSQSPGRHLSSTQKELERPPSTKWQEIDLGQRQSSSHLRKDEAGLITTTANVYQTPSRYSVQQQGPLMSQVEERARLDTDRQTSSKPCMTSEKPNHSQAFRATFSIFEGNASSSDASVQRPPEKKASNFSKLGSFVSKTSLDEKAALDIEEASISVKSLLSAFETVATQSHELRRSDSNDTTNASVKSLREKFEAPPLPQGNGSEVNKMRKKFEVNKKRKPSSKTFERGSTELQDAFSKFQSRPGDRDKSKPPMARSARIQTASVPPSTRKYGIGQPRVSSSGRAIVSFPEPGPPPIVDEEVEIHAKVAQTDPKLGDKLPSLPPRVDAQSTAARSIMDTAIDAKASVVPALPENEGVQPKIVTSPVKSKQITSASVLPKESKQSDTATEQTPGSAQPRDASPLLVNDPGDKSMLDEDNASVPIAQSSLPTGVGSRNRYVSVTERVRNIRSLSAPRTASSPCLMDDNREDNKNSTNKSEQSSGRPSNDRGSRRYATYEIRTVDVPTVGIFQAETSLLSKGEDTGQNNPQLRQNGLVLRGNQTDEPKTSSSQELAKQKLTQAAIAMKSGPPRNGGDRLSSWHMVAQPIITKSPRGTTSAAPNQQDPTAANSFDPELTQEKVAESGSVVNTASVHVQVPSGTTLAKETAMVSSFGQLVQSSTPPMPGKPGPIHASNIGHTAPPSQLSTSHFRAFEPNQAQVLPPRSSPSQQSHGKPQFSRTIGNLNASGSSPIALHGQYAHHFALNSSPQPVPARGEYRSEASGQRGTEKNSGQHEDISKAVETSLATPGRYAHQLAPKSSPRSGPGQGEFQSEAFGQRGTETNPGQHQGISETVEASFAPPGRYAHQLASKSSLRSSPAQGEFQSEAFGQKGTESNPGQHPGISETVRTSFAPPGRYAHQLAPKSSPGSSPAQGGFQSEAFGQRGTETNPGQHRGISETVETSFAPPGRYVHQLAPKSSPRSSPTRGEFQSEAFGRKGTEANPGQPPGISETVETSFAPPGRYAHQLAPKSSPRSSPAQGEFQSEALGQSGAEPNPGQHQGVSGTPEKSNILNSRLSGGYSGLHDPGPEEPRQQPHSLKRNPPPSDTLSTPILQSQHHDDTGLPVTQSTLDEAVVRPPAETHSSMSPYIKPGSKNWDEKRCVELPSTPSRSRLCSTGLHQSIASKFEHQPPVAIASEQSSFQLRGENQSSLLKAMPEPHVFLYEDTQPVRCSVTPPSSIPTYVSSVADKAPEYIPGNRSADGPVETPREASRLQLHGNTLVSADGPVETPREASRLQLHGNTLVSVHQSESKLLSNHVLGQHEQSADTGHENPSSKTTLPGTIPRLPVTPNTIRKSVGSQAKASFSYRGEINSSEARHSFARTVTPNDLSISPLSARNGSSFRLQSRPKSPDPSHTQQARSPPRRLSPISLPRKTFSTPALFPLHNRNPEPFEPNPVLQSPAMIGLRSGLVSGDDRATLPHMQQDDSPTDRVSKYQNNLSSESPEITPSLVSQKKFESPEETGTPDPRPEVVQQEIVENPWQLALSLEHLAGKEDSDAPVLLRNGVTYVQPVKSTLLDSDKGIREQSSSLSNDSEFSDGVTLDASIAEVSGLTMPTALATHFSWSFAADSRDESSGGVNSILDNDTTRRSEASSSQTPEILAPLIAHVMRASDDFSASASGWDAPKETSVPADDDEFSREEKKIDDGHWYTRRAASFQTTESSVPSSSNLFQFEANWSSFSLPSSSSVDDRKTDTQALGTLMSATTNNTPAPNHQSRPGTRTPPRSSNDQHTTHTHMRTPTQPDRASQGISTVSENNSPSCSSKPLDVAFSLFSSPRSNIGAKTRQLGKTVPARLPAAARVGRRAQSKSQTRTSSAALKQTGANRSTFIKLSGTGPRHRYGKGDESRRDWATLPRIPEASDGSSDHTSQISASPPTHSATREKINNLPTISSQGQSRSTPEHVGRKAYEQKIRPISSSSVAMARLQAVRRNRELRRTGAIALNKNIAFEE